MIKPAPASIFALFPVSRTFVGFLFLAFLTACGQKPETADTTRKVWFGNLTDGQEVYSPFNVEMKAANLVVEPAATGITDGHGHFHILIDVPLPEAPNPIPFDAQHRHFGGGDTMTTLDLPPGEHTLTLQFAKGDHVPYDPQIVHTIRIRVVDPVE